MSNEEPFRSGMEHGSVIRELREAAAEADATGLVAVSPLLLGAAASIIMELAIPDPVQRHFVETFWENYP